MFKRVLIANRGEIAVRIIRACREMDIETVAVYSEADRGALHTRLADKAVCIGPAPANRSYLHIPSIIAAAQMSGADAIHPGYGFLAENPYFAEMCATAGITFIGPSPRSMQLMGAKATARATMIAAGVPVVPGSEGVVKDLDAALAIAKEIGYPVLIKASAGGGGRGMRVAQGPRELRQAIQTAQREAEAAFGDSQVYLEKYIEEPRHIEFQILGDTEGNLIHLGERDCSLQRRNQKILEEAPSVALTPELRREMGEVALKAARAVDYYSTGTVEFLLDKHGRYYFIEMNTRIQVEHPVTEAVTGIDLVQEQIRIAAGEPLSIRQEDVQIRGHAIECRINAEDPNHNFRPAPGRIERYHVPGGFGIRVDSAVYSGYFIPPFYDSLIAKVIAWAPDREGAINRMAGALKEMVIEGVPTTIPFHQQILANAFFRRGEIYTNFIQRRLLAG
ncbi:MAG: acetyl-CoA carboxylase, biotin carboxylase subunit [Moorella sp. (in: firmicutes)]|jgi:acetyl-CoA carboxylase biotin carboxylase subunit|uniref:acetyl-CoA carboxylase biotin carboxylase subunit n=1 Tax=unclassified Neomoorella TaxID=2676739 RepID=UPI0010FFAFD8|nr:MULTISPECIES: acetyl-CoA carboxylase biotin carboxylase subunit [unclassified Moorella (in: firmicutes)]MDK2817203.1 acetyl-CoA carboxylase, biotin carboxylase subunit [Moorella sp. (in: firmicutes)]GEA15959.1 acetyl-CoA carboxylase biotin carboxylase subunit [Moorella sp. E308F]GEA19223.1 acetyl-CoA carboxylase biotin carboxylase subunit [Moorella sp. E306M]